MNWLWYTLYIPYIQHVYKLYTYAMYTTNICHIRLVYLSCMSYILLHVFVYTNAGISLYTYVAGSSRPSGGRRELQ